VNLILLGAPGAGKGTQGALLAERRGLARISTGDLLRSALKRGTPLGLLAKKYMEAGELVPDSVILDLVREVLSGGEVAAEVGGADAIERGFILDGFPRTIPQAEGLNELLGELGRPLDAILLIDVPDEKLIQRISGRRSCPSCGAVYNVFFDPPAVDGVCNACGATLVQRADDVAETVQRRLQVYRDQTEPLVSFYERTGTSVHRVEGDLPVEEVQTQVARLLDR
jgi:adenylate kinase